MENENNNKRKKRLIPLIWWFGGAIAGGGLIALAVLLANKNGQVKDLELKLNETEKACMTERDSLSNEIRTLSNDYDTLQADYEVLGADLKTTQERNARLLAANASYNEQLMKCGNENAALQASIDKYLTENRSLSDKVGILNSQVEDLQAQLDESNSTNTLQSEIINDQNERITSDSTAWAEAEQIRKEEDVSGYFNNTDIGAAIGLKIRSVPYSHHFYGINMINGYVINRHFMTGIGVGLNAYNGGMMAPLYLDLRYNFRKTGFRPYVFADAGLLLVFDDMDEPGLFINPGAGVFRNITDRLAVNLGAGFFVQRTPVKASFINFKLGLIILGKKEE